MSRPKSIDTLLAGAASDIAPTVADLSKGQEDQPLTAQTPEPLKEAKKTVPERKLRTPARRASSEHGPIRFQISAPEGSEVERALADILDAIPQAFRSGVSMGTLFRQVMIDNDAELARMIRKSVVGEHQ